MVDQRILDAMVAEVDRVPGLDEKIVQYVNGEIDVAVLQFDRAALAPSLAQRASLAARYDAADNDRDRHLLTQAILETDSLIREAEKFIDNPTFAYWTFQPEAAHAG